jgi:hypothetical protein
MWDQASRHQIRAADIRVDNLAPVFVRRVGQCVICGIHARAVEDVVDTAEIPQRGFHGFGDARRGCHIELVYAVLFALTLERF